MADAQKAQFLALIEARLGILNADDLAAAMVAVKENIDQTTFAWWGPTEPLGAAYVRVTGPALMIEFSPQDNDGDPAGPRPQHVPLHSDRALICVRLMSGVLLGIKHVYEGTEPLGYSGLDCYKHEVILWNLQKSQSIANTP